MKKLIVLLLALAMVGGAYAQVTTAVALSGGTTIIDQAGQSTFGMDGLWYDTLTFKGAEKDGKYGFSVTYPDILNLDTVGVGGWNVYYVGNYVKYTIGQGLSNGTFRASLAKYWKTGFGRLDGIADKYGVSLQSTTLGDLVVGAFFPVLDVGGPFVNVLKGSDYGVKYTMKDIGFAQAYVNLATGANKVGLGFTYNGMKDLTVAAIGQVGIDAKKYQVGASAKYTGVEKLTAMVQASDTVNAGANSFDVYGEAGYDVMDNVFASAWAKFASTGSVFSLGAFVDYGFANGLTLEGNGSYNLATKTLGADLTLYWGVSF